MTKFALALFALLGVSAALTSCSTTRQISNGSTNMCMNVENHGFPVAGTAIRVKPCDPWQNQQWALNNGQITGVGGFCIDVQGSAAGVGVPAIYVPCNGSPSQQWTVANGIIVGIGGYCLDVGGRLPANWTPLVLATCNGSPNQHWAVH